MDVAEIFNRELDRMIEIDPDFYEYHYLKGKNLLAGLVRPEEYVVQNREELETRPELAEMKEKIIDTKKIAERAGGSIAQQDYERFVKPYDGKTILEDIRRGYGLSRHSRRF